MLTIYSKSNCPQCDIARDLLTRRKIKFTELKIDQNAEAREFLLNAGHRSVPQFYDGSAYVGDYHSFIKPFTKK